MKSHTMSLFKLGHTAFLMAFFFVLPACDLYEESWTTKERIQVSQERFYESFVVTEFDNALMSHLARTYSRHGGGPMKVSVTYDPASRNYTALSAGNEMARISKSLRAQGVRDLDIGLMPATTYAGQVIVSYESYTAEAPKNCGTMPGLKSSDDVGTSLESGEEYGLGCTIETLMARQISRPKDLLGQGQTETTVDGRRVVNSVEVYRDGIPNEPLEGETATDE